MLVVRLLLTAVVIAGAKQNDMSSVFLGAAASMLHSSELSTVVGWRDLVPHPSVDVAEAMLAPGVELVFHTTIAASTLHGKTSGAGKKGWGEGGEAQDTVSPRGRIVARKGIPKPYLPTRLVQSW